MKNIKTRLAQIMIGAVLFSGCTDLFNPAIENTRHLDPSTYLPKDSRFPLGLLMNGYTRLPTNSWAFSEVATDDAVINDQNNAYLKIATGQWTANSNPTNQWTNCFAGIQYMNITLGEVDKVQWVNDEGANKLFGMRIKGEAYGLRALLMYHLLEAHAGVSNGGALLGVPIILEPQKVGDNFNQKRATFEECVQQIYSDLAKAEELLPLDFLDINNASQIATKYGSVRPDQYNRAFGTTFSGLLAGRMVKAIKAKTALLAASPAYNKGDATKWVDAANYFAEVLTLKGGLSALPSNTASGLAWYSNASELGSLGEGANPPEILWRNNISDSRNLEEDNFPPTLFGRGRVNPTQNLVDAFPMLNGYPITDPASGYNANDPYTNRDPRLKMFILVNGSTGGVSNTVISTAEDGTTNDGLNKVATSTRTGYYLRKLLRQDVNLNPTSATNQRHYKPHIRYTEIALSYAEAANEAWGPTGTGSNAFSAYDMIKRIRTRAGIGLNNNDSYLESSKNSKEAMRELIRNERRLELCFEGFRFWDLRRWDLNLNETAKGMRIRVNGYTVIPSVEVRTFQNYMKHGPIPYSEILKFPALEQNQGWN